MLQDLLTGFSIYLGIEGMIPFAGPNRFRQSVARLAQKLRRALDAVHGEARVKARERHRPAADPAAGPEHIGRA